MHLKQGITKTYTASAIRHLATTREGNIVVVGLFEAHCLNLGRRHRQTYLGVRDNPWLRRKSVGSITTGIRLSGRRMAPRSGLLRCPVRSDALAAQGLEGDWAGRRRAGWTARHCCCKGPCQILNVATGETTERLRGVRKVWVDSTEGLRLQKSSTLTVVDRFGKKLFGITPSSFAVLDASFSRRYLAILGGRF